MERIKVLRIIARLNIGGPAIHTVLLTEGLNKQKFESVLVTGIVNPNEGDMTYLAHDRGINPIVIKELGREISWRDDLTALWKIFQLLRKENPDIVHTHTAKAGTLGRLSVIIYNCLSFIINRSSTRRTKLVHTFHGHVFHDYFNPLKTKIFILIERLLSRFTDRIVAISPKQATDIFGKYRIAPQKKISAISLGLDLNKYLNSNVNGSTFRDKWRISNDTALIGIVGRLVPVKNHKMFLESLKAIKESNPTFDVRFIIVGDGELRRELSNQVITHGLKDGVIFTGWQKKLDVIYASLDVVALTSLNEGTPVSLIEAMAAGKAIVSTRVGGVVDLLGKFHKKINSTTIEIYDNGILVESGDVAGFTKALGLLFEDKSLRDKMGTSGREFVKERFNIDRLVNDMEKLYESL